MKENKHLSDQEVERLLRINRLAEHNFNFDIKVLLQAGYSLSLIEALANSRYSFTPKNAENMEKMLKGQPYEALDTKPIIITDEDVRKYGFH